MSTDLHLHHDLPKLRISTVKMETQSQNHNQNDNQIAKTELVSDDEEVKTPSSVASCAVEIDGVVLKEGEEEEEESYRTPTSKESKIPEMLTCPPAPRKGKAMVSCKRKLLEEFQFFEVPSNEDMDAFFRSTFPKRTCPCT